MIKKIKAFRFLFSNNLSIKAQKSLFKASLLQVLLSGIEMFALVLVGLISTLSVSDSNSSGYGEGTKKLLKILNIENLESRTRLILLVGICAVLLTTKTYGSMLFAKHTFRLLSRESARITNLIYRKTMLSGIFQVTDKSSQQFIYLATNGVRALLLGMVAPVVNILSDLFLVLVILIFLLIVQPIVALTTLIFILVLGTLLYHLQHETARNLGNLQFTEEIKSNRHILKSLEMYREIYLYSKIDDFVTRASDQRYRIAEIDAKLAFMPQITKYVIELGIVVGAIIVATVQIIFSDLNSSITVLIIFLISGLRMAPPILRIQNMAISMKSSQGLADETSKLIGEINGLSLDLNHLDEELQNHLYHPVFINVNSVSFAYGAKTQDVIDNISFEVQKGEKILFSGNSGSGKSTLLNLIIGLYAPSKGKIKINGVDPASLISAQPGFISYVPQEVVLFEESVANNVAFEFSNLQVDHEWLLKILEIVELQEVIPCGKLYENSWLKEDGNNISGGQKQRIGIARALYQKPKLLVLDEATNALDKESEARVMKNIFETFPDLTLLFVSHRDSAKQFSTREIELLPKI